GQNLHPGVQPPDGAPRRRGNAAGPHPRIVGEKTMSMRICVIFNPAARGEKAARFRQHLAELSTQCTLKPTYAAGAGRALGAEAVREGFEVVVAAGGDGTVNEVLNGIGDVPDAFSRTRFAVLPLGTINVFARELRMPSDFARAWSVIKQARDTT